MKRKSIRHHELNTKRLPSVERGIRASEKQMSWKPINLSMPHLRVKHTSFITFKKIDRDDGEEELAGTKVPTSPTFNSMAMKEVHEHGCGISYDGSGLPKSRTSSCLHSALVTWNEESLDSCINTKGYIVMLRIS